MDGREHPPTWLRQLLGRILPRHERASLLDEMDALYARRHGLHGAVRATLWYARQLPSFAWRLGAHRLGRRRGVAGPRRSRGRVRSGAMPSAISRNIGIAVRGLRRRPAYTAASILALGTGVAAVSTVHGVADWTLLRPVPGVASPGTLVTILLGSTDTPGSWPISDPDFRFIADRVRRLERIAAASEQDVDVSVSGSDTPERVRAQAVTEGYFDVLGVRMATGRPFTEAEARGREDPYVMVLSETFARRRWGRPESAVGTELLVNGRQYTVIGVAGPGFRGEMLPGRVELWLPGGALPAALHVPDLLDDAGRQVWTTLIGRRPEEVGVSAIRSEMNALMQAVRTERMGQQHSFLATHFRFEVWEGIGLDPSLRVPTVRTLGILGGSAFLLLLLVCANVANLGLARAASLHSAVAIRRALGASGSAVAAERLTESVVLGLAGGVVGVGLAAGILVILEAGGLGLLGISLDGVALDWRVAGVTLGVGIAAGALAGVVPAIDSNRQHAASLLRSGRRVDRASGRAGRLLVSTQVAISAVLLVGAVLLARTLQNLSRIDLGVRPAGVTAFQLDPALEAYDGASTARLIETLSAQIAAGPGVQSVAAVWSPPFESLHFPYSFKRADADWAESAVARSFQMTAGLFETLGIELIAGRTFRPDEVRRGAAATERVVILNESAARAAFPSLQPAQVVGRYVQSRRAGDEAVRVIGIARDARLYRPSSPPRASVFLPWAQGFEVGRFTMYIRSGRSLDDMTRLVRERVRTIDEALPVFGSRWWTDEIRSLLAEQRLVATLALGLAIFGLVLAAIGLYGVLALAVTQRTREIGIRRALGALPASTVTLIVRSGIVLTLRGLVPGLLAGAWLSRILESRLYGVAHLDPGPYVAGATTLLLVASAACWLPARRAVRVAPMDVLRDS